MNLYVNNTKIELAPGEQITLSKAVGRVGEIGTRSGVISADFDVLATSVNLDTLGYNDQLESENTVLPRNKQSAYIEDEGHEITRGFIQIVSTDKVGKRISLAFYGDNADWFELLKGRYLSDIDFTDLDHDWTEANITASWTNTDGYIYPALDYGRLSGSTVYETEVDDWYPAIYRHTIIGRIFRGINYTITGNFLDTFAYKNCILPFSLGKFERATDQLLAEAFKDATINYPLAGLPAGGASDSATHIIDIDTIIFDPQSAFNLTTDRYTAPAAFTDATFIFRFSSTQAIDISSGAGCTATIKFKVRKNGATDLMEETLLTITGDTSTSQTDFYEYAVTTDLAASDYIEAIFLEEYSGATPSTTIVSLSVNANNFTFRLDSIDPLIAVGGAVSVGKILPEMTQLDFVKDMIMQNNLIVSGNPVSGTIAFNHFDELYKNMPDASDWSDRIDLSGIHSVDFTEVVSDYANINRFKFSDPNDDAENLVNYNAEKEKAYGEGRIIIDNDFIPNENIAYESPFEATFMADSIVVATGTIPLGFIPYWGPVGAIPLMTAGELESGARILYVVPNVSVSDFSIGTAYSQVKIDATFYTEAAYGYFAKRRRNSSLDTYTDNLAYDMPEILAVVGDGLLEKNYKNTQRILNKPRYIEISVRLWPHEFREIDFTVPVYIHAGNLRGYFYIDEIDDYVGNRVPATVKLIQLI